MTLRINPGTSIPAGQSVLQGASKQKRHRVASALAEAEPASGPPGPTVERRFCFVIFCKLLLTECKPIIKSCSSCCQEKDLSPGRASLRPARKCLLTRVLTFRRDARLCGLRHTQPIPSSLLSLCGHAGVPAGALEPRVALQDDLFDTEHRAFRADPLLLDDPFLRNRDYTG